MISLHYHLSVIFCSSKEPDLLTIESLQKSVFILECKYCIISRMKLILKLNDSCIPRCRSCAHRLQPQCLTGCIIIHDTRTTDTSECIHVNLYNEILEVWLQRLFVDNVDVC